MADFLQHKNVEGDLARRGERRYYREITDWHVRRQAEGWVSSTPNASASPPRGIEYKERRYPAHRHIRAAKLLAVIGRAVYQVAKQHCIESIAEGRQDGWSCSVRPSLPRQPETPDSATGPIGRQHRSMVTDHALGCALPEIQFDRAIAAAAPPPCRLERPPILRHYRSSATFLPREQDCTMATDQASAYMTDQVQANVGMRPRCAGILEHPSGVRERRRDRSTCPDPAHECRTRGRFIGVCHALQA